MNDKNEKKVDYIQMSLAMFRKMAQPMAQQLSQRKPKHGAVIQSLLFRNPKRTHSSTS